MPSSKALLLALAGLAVCTGVAHAQYKWVDEKGRVGYSDLPPSGNVKILRGPQAAPASNATRSRVANTSDELPVELSRLAQRSPVTLYSTSNCAPCDLARLHLERRGVPYTEKIVSSAQDVLAFTRLGFPADTGLPVVTVGSARQVGYHAARWDEAFTQSGYPQESRLPRSWSPAAPASLAVETQSAEVPSSEVPIASKATNGLVPARRSPTGSSAETPGMRF